MDIYQDFGYDSRDHYLRVIAEKYGIKIDTVLYLAEILGDNEDFDGLLTMLEEIEI